MPAKDSTKTKAEVVTREYTINLHKRTHKMCVRAAAGPAAVDVRRASPCPCPAPAAQHLQAQGAAGDL